MTKEQVFAEGIGGHTTPDSLSVHREKLAEITLKSHKKISGPLVSH